MKKARTILRLDQLQLNEGQLDWLGRNPRKGTQEDIDKCVASLLEDPDWLEDKPLSVVPAKETDQYVVFIGNLRTISAPIAGLTEVPCIIYKPEKTPDPGKGGKLTYEVDRETVRRRALKDNGTFGHWDFDELPNWGVDAEQLGKWGIETPEGWSVADQQTGGSGEPGSGNSDGGAGKRTVPIPEGVDVETLLDEAMRHNVTESLAQIDAAMKQGWFVTFFTEGAAQAKFLRAKYYGEHYPQYLSLYFCPERFWTSANTCSPYDQMKKIAGGENAGIAGLRTLSGDNLLLLLLKGSYPFGGARMPMDFPAGKARDLILEFGGKGCRVLDPCHGWGGRLAGSLMADVSLYCGIDPSEEAHRGVERAARAFLPYCPDSKVEFIEQPFEDVDLGDRVFDLAITSPPYFDVEQYHGKGQSHVKFPNFEDWCEGFFRPLIEKTYATLRPGGAFILNVGSQTYPLREEAEKIAQNVGFQIDEVRPMGGDKLLITRK